MNIIALISAMTGSMILVITVLIGNRLQNKWLGYGFAVIGLIIGLVTIAFIPSFIGDDRGVTAAKSGEYLVYIILFFTVVKGLFFRNKNKEDIQNVEQAPEQITGLGHGLSTKQDNKISTFTKFKKNASLIASTGMLAVLSVTILNIHFSVKKNIEKSDKALTELKDVYFNEKVVAEPQNSKSFNTSENNTENKTDKEIVLDFGKQYILEKNKMSEAYRNEYDALGIHLIIDIDRLQNDRDMKKIMPKIQEGYGVVHKYKTLNDQSFNTFKGRLQALPIGQESKKLVIEGYNRSEASNKKHLAKFWNLQKESIQEFESFAIWLASAREHWGIADEVIVFQSNEKLDIFNQYLANLNHISEQEDKLRAIQDQRIRNL